MNDKPTRRISPFKQEDEPEYSYDTDTRKNKKRGKWESNSLVGVRRPEGVRWYLGKGSAPLKHKQGQERAIIASEMQALEKARSTPADSVSSVKVKKYLRPDNFESVKRALSQSRLITERKERKL